MNYKDDLIYKSSFVHFFFGVFALGVKRVEGQFLFGNHLVEWAYLLQKYNRVSIVSARFHLKSTIALGYLAWRLYKMENRYEDWLFMAYKEDLAGKQIKRLKRYLEAIPLYFDGYVSLTSADSIIRYVKGGKEFLVEPAGVLAFKRGMHPYGMICDDILKDPTSSLNLRVLMDIERVFFEEISSMPKEKLFVLGTKQDAEDLFGKLEANPEYMSREYPAVLDWEHKKALWAERWGFDALMKKKKEIGDKAFKKEFLCAPVRGEEGFIDRDKLNFLIKSRLRNLKPVREYKFRESCFAGWDLGKKRHPSHFCVFAVDRHNRLVQIHSKFFDGVDYKDQIAYIDRCIECFGIAKVMFDNTRGEMEGYIEQGDLSGEYEPIVFTSKGKFEMASLLDRHITNGTIWLLPDGRQKRQLLSVDNDLKSIETIEGHGDAFFSLCLAVRAYEEGAGVLLW